MNGGTCVAPGVCDCAVGYQGPHCEGGDAPSAGIASFCKPPRAFFQFFPFSSAAAPLFVLECFSSAVLDEAHIVHPARDQAGCKLSRDTKRMALGDIL
ncbi:hypothetical protein HPB50_020745 [Hyalomma asiaticum]|uniref:Uncharacterized protein n=1 Tax=Hyalomma asiaticum TaxID=266040 RepID=A0ACB7RMH9_HYAAI|nr:hypothetical protein HPB50_020745 [Hyalomma asiaticum]